MTIQELETAFAGRKIIRHRGQVFVNSRDPDEVAFYRSLGATTLVESYRNQYTAEIHLASLLDAMPEVDDDGEEYDARPAFILAHFRERDGFSTPASLVL